MAGSNALDFEILGRVAGEFEDFRGEVFEDGGDVNSGLNGSLVSAELQIFCETRGGI